MAELLSIYFLPPFAVARLGASDTPLEAFEWVEDETTHGGGKTVINPTVSLEILGDGSIRPYTPSTIRFRDGPEALIRPTAPFFELWAKFDDAEALRPLTSQLLSELGSGLGHLTYRISAANLKAARRCNDPSCGFAADVMVRGDDFTPKPLLASSPNIPDHEPLVPSTKPILLGHLQVIRPKPGTSANVNLDTLRLRITPGSGQVYGPPKATSARDPAVSGGPEYLIVPEANRILNGNAAWPNFEVGNKENPEPSDTYDGADDNLNSGGRSWGVVDDACDMTIEASVEVGGKEFVARARATAGPPDFAPDRRPFLSLADDLADRELPPSDVTKPEIVNEIADLLARVYETVSLVNLDSLRAEFTGDRPPKPNPVPVVGRESMTKADRPLAYETAINPPPGPQGSRLFYAPTATETHQPLANIDSMLELFKNEGDRLRHLLRPPFARFRDLPAKPPTPLPTDRIGLRPRERDPRVLRDHQHDMRMPPYMRDADASPLSLSWRQYHAVIDFIARVEAAGPKEMALLSPVLSHAARVVARRRAVAAPAAKVAKATKGPRRPSKRGARPAAKAKPARRAGKPAAKPRRRGR